MTAPTIERRYAYYVAYTATLTNPYNLQATTTTGSQPIYMPAPIRCADHIADLQDEIKRNLRSDGAIPAPGTSIVITWWERLPGDDIPAQ